MLWKPWDNPTSRTVHFEDLNGIGGNDGSVDLFVWRFFGKLRFHNGAGVEVKVSEDTEWRMIKEITMAASAEPISFVCE